ncbi:MAG: MASE1 domain-containing protein [Pseudomonadota bacterium]
MLADSPQIGARRSLAVHLRDAAMFAACYVALDWASYIYPLGPFNITPWNPPPALSIVWMMLGGLAYAPVIFSTIFIADIIIRQAPGGLIFTALTSLVLAGGYTAIAGTLRYFLKSDARLSDTRHLWMFVAVTTAGTAIVGTFYVGALWANGFLLGELFSAAVFRFWLGDAVGVLITAPLLLLVADEVARKCLLNSWRRPETALQFAVMVATVYFVFEGAGGEPSKYFYLLFLPLIWIALRGGFVGAAVASGVVQVGVVLGVHGGPMHSLALVELQALVAALSLTGLFLGVMVDERERATESLKASLRLAAAGEMAGAIAHEINQPLAALSNYGRACQLFLERGEGAVPYAELDATIGKMLGESKRAAEVVGRLRDFFRSGTTQLEEVTVESLLESARRIGSKLDASGEVDFRVETDTSASVLLADRLQIELVLRNLLANAFEAVANQPAGKKRVTVSAHAIDGGRISFRTTDTGPGLSPSARELLFEPYSSTKPTGMGLGLVISQAIAEAHGGSLSAAHTKHGEFHLILPGLAADE